MWLLTATLAGIGFSLALVFLQELRRGLVSAREQQAIPPRSYREARQTHFAALKASKQSAHQLEHEAV